jgi:chromosomal replication initiation ATPase DnaA
LEIKSVNSDVIVLLAKNLFAKHILTNEYTEIITMVLNKVLGGKFEIKFSTQDEHEEFQSVAVRTPQHAPSKPLNINSLNPNYNFSNFVVSEFNKSAYNAAQSLFKNTF